MRTHKKDEKVADRIHDIAEKTGNVFNLMQSQNKKVIQAILDGRLEEAMDLSREIVNLGRDSEFLLFAQAMFFNCGLRPRLYLGRAKSVVNKNVLNYFTPLDASRAWLLGLLGRNDEADNQMDEILKTQMNIPLEDDQIGTNIYATYLEAALITGHKKMIERAIQKFKNTDPKISGFIQPTIIPRHLGAGAAMLGRYDEARSHYLRAIEIAEDTRFRPELALSRFQLAELQFEHFPDEKEEVIEHLNFAIEEFKEMKMQPSLEKAEKLAKKYN